MTFLQNLFLSLNSLIGVYARNFNLNVFCITVIFLYSPLDRQRDSIIVSICTSINTWVLRPLNISYQLNFSFIYLHIFGFHSDLLLIIVIWNLYNSSVIFQLFNIYIALALIACIINNIIFIFYCEIKICVFWEFVFRQSSIK